MQVSLGNKEIEIKFEKNCNLPKLFLFTNDTRIRGKKKTV